MAVGGCRWFLVVLGRSMLEYLPYLKNGSM